MFYKKTKIIATIGPASERVDKLEKMILAGMDAARLNFSHGSHEEQGRRIKTIRQLEKKFKKYIAIVADIQGPKIRVGNLPEQGIELKNGEEVLIDTGTREFYENRIPLPSLLFRDGTKPGHIVFLDDGTLQLKITESRAGIFKAIVLKGGILYPKKGVNVPSLEVKSSILSAKDKADIEFAIKSGVDYIALSFLRNAQDIKDARKFIGDKQVKIIAKIERPEALVNLDEIVDEADAVMVARGDLGIETPLWELPIRQKEIVDRVRKEMKPVIVATQMLDSMIRNPIPTRAEVSDVSNAVYDSADAVMLSGETANGRYPFESVEMMRKILEATERNQNGKNKFDDDQSSALVSVAKASTVIAEELGAKAILTGAITGTSARIISHFRPSTPLIAMAYNESVARQLALTWGVNPILINGKKIQAAKDLISPAVKILKASGFLNTGDKIVCRYNKILGEPETANTVTVETI
jgi:pyruvate kinase